MSLRVLLIPDTVYWIEGTLARSIARCHPWIRPTIISGPIAKELIRRDPEFLSNFDLVHFVCDLVSRDLLPITLPRLPTVTTIHHVMEWEDLQHNLKSDAIMVAAKEWHEYLIRRDVAADSLFLIRYGVNTKLFSPVSPARRLFRRTRLGLRPGDFVVGFMGKQNSDDHGRKGIDVFRAAAKQLAEKMPNLVVLIVGPGWHEFVLDLKKQNIRCRWLGFIPRQTDLAKIYPCLDCYWVTARVEGGPVPLLEAMSSEIASITTPVGLAIDLVVNGENGIRVPMNDPQAVVDQTLALAADPQRRREIGVHARKSIQEHFDEEVTTRPIPAVYDLARRNFAARTASQSGTQALPDLEATVGELAQKSFSPDRSLERWILTQEDLFWLTRIRLMRQRREILRLGIRILIREPFNTEVRRILVQEFCPKQLARSYGRIKNLVLCKKHPVAPSD